MGRSGHSCFEQQDNKIWQYDNQLSEFFDRSRPKSAIIMFYGFAKMREIRARRAMLAEVSVKCGSLPPDAGDLRALLPSVRTFRDLCSRPLKSFEQSRRIMPRWIFFPVIQFTYQSKQSKQAYHTSETRGVPVTDGDPPPTIAVHREAYI